jgi:hypothetical protein
MRRGFGGKIGKLKKNFITFTTISYRKSTLKKGADFDTFAQVRPFIESQIPPLGFASVGTTRGRF